VGNRDADVAAKPTPLRVEPSDLAVLLELHRAVFFEAVNHAAHRFSDLSHGDPPDVELVLSRLIDETAGW